VFEPQFLDLGWLAPKGVRAAFTLRCAGASAGPYAAFNTATHVGDEPNAVQRNRAALRTALHLTSEPSWLEQVHGAEVCDLDRESAPVESRVPIADAAVTTRSDRVCVVQVADCLPVLFATRDGARVAAAHAGWRGLANGVLEATVASLGVPAGTLTVWLGPAISQRHFEVGAEVRQAFLAHHDSATEAFTANERGRWQCDLNQLARRRLAALGVREIAGGKWCTFSDREKFFSHRRDGVTGRMAALIWRD
jgi:polyphenol oxidase